MREPYVGLPRRQWKARTQELLASHPLEAQEIVEVVLSCWNSILQTRVGGRAQIGVHIFPRPQIMGMFLHELIPLEFAARYPGTWRREQSVDEKDLVYVPDAEQSVEIKTSSSASRIFGNRSYAQPGKMLKKTKSGYYLAVNFTKFEGTNRPAVTKIHFGWLDGADWIGQKAQTGQQSRLPSHIYGSKLLPLYPTT